MEYIETCVFYCNNQSEICKSPAIVNLAHSLGGASKLITLLSKTARSSKFVLATIERDLFFLSLRFYGFGG
jgi:hypothetical protein